MRHPVRYLVIGVLLVAGLFCGNESASACAVCFGDKESSMVQGAASGVWVMLAVTYGLLFTFVGFTAMFFVRARRLRRAAGAGRHWTDGPGR